MPKKAEVAFDKLTVKGNEIRTRLLDAEGDAVNIEFHVDDSIMIDTNNQTYVMLTRDDLFNILNFMDEAETEFEKMPEPKED